MHSIAKLVIVVVTLVAVIRLTNAAVAMEIVEGAPGDSNKCFRKRDGLTLAIGEEKAMPDCTKVSCEKNADNYVLHITGCGFVVENARCKKVEHPEKKHPDCCPTLKCT